VAGLACAAMGDLRFVAVRDLGVDGGTCWAELELSEHVDEARARFIEGFDLDPGGRVHVGEVEAVAGKLVRLRADSREQLTALVRALQEWGLTKAVERQASHDAEVAALRTELTQILRAPAPPPHEQQ